MAKPNSLTTHIRRALASMLEPRPDIGEAWCIGCRLNQDKTAVIPVDGIVNHTEFHASHLGPKSFMNVVGTRTSTKES